MTNWWPPVIALAVGAVIAIVMMLRRGGTPVVPDEELARLDRTVDALVEQIRELNAERHLYDAAKFTAEVQRLEREAADAMRAKEAHKAAPRKKAERPVAAKKNDGFAARHPQIVGALWGGGTVAFLSLAFFFATAESKPTPGAATGDPKYEAVLMLSAIAISFQDSEQLLQAWELYMRQPVPRRRPPQLGRAIEWLEKTISE